MATARSFEDLDVYRLARQLAGAVYDVTRSAGFAKDFGLVDQIRRAAVSIISNIAEGFERGGNAEFVQFLCIAKGSCGEVRAQLTIAFDQKYIDEDTFDRLVDDARHISSMLSKLRDHVKRSSYRGSRYDTKSTPSKEL